MKIELKIREEILKDILERNRIQWKQEITARGDKNTEVSLVNLEVSREGTGCFGVPPSPRGNVLQRLTGWVQNQMARVQIPALPLCSHGILWGLTFPIIK